MDRTQQPNVREAGTVQAALAEAYAPIASELDQARTCFDAEIRSPRPTINELCEQVKRYRGKMLRPALLLLSGKAAGELADAHITLAAVVEMVHVATLVHDDVLDEADVRRRQTTVNAMSGNETAVMLGDYLISHAFHLCSSLDSQHASREIGATTNTICTGELCQLHHRGDPELSEADYLDIITNKTAVLTGTSCSLGARFAGATESMVEGMRRFGTDLGIAFQIVDDLLDLLGSQERVGKTVGRDLDLGKPTLPVIHGIANGTPEARTQLTAMIRGEDAGESLGVEKLLLRSGSIDYAHNAAQRHLDSAHEILVTLPDSPAKASLIAMAGFVLRRDH